MNAPEKAMIALWLACNIIFMVCALTILLTWLINKNKKRRALFETGSLSERFETYTLGGLVLIGFYTVNSFAMLRALTVWIYSILN